MNKPFIIVAAIILGVVLLCLEFSQGPGPSGVFLLGLILLLVAIARKTRRRAR